MATWTVAVVVCTGRVVNEGVATVASACAAVRLIMQIIVTVLIIMQIVATIAGVVTGIIVPIVLGHVARICSRRFAKRSRNWVMFWFSVVRRLVVWDDRVIRLRVSVVLHLGKKSV